MPIWVVRAMARPITAPDKNQTFNFFFSTALVTRRIDKTIKEAVDEDFYNEY